MCFGKQVVEVELALDTFSLVIDGDYLVREFEEVEAKACRFNRGVVIERFGLMLLDRVAKCFARIAIMFIFGGGPILCGTEPLDFAEVAELLQFGISK